MRVALLHLRNSRPHAPEFQRDLDMLTQGALDAIHRLGWSADLVASSEVPVSDTMNLAKRCDAVVLLGGEDVTPELYGGRTTYPGSGHHEPHADRAHTAVIHEAIKHQQPLLGICRGLQLMNVALGGTLIQHLDPSESHRADGSGMDAYVQSNVSVDQNTDLYADVPVGPMYCTHHQAVDTLGVGLTAVANTADGVIEAVIHESAPLTGVQWHPERPDVAPIQLTPLLERLSRQLSRNESHTEHVQQAG